jgi:hypothetical protein
MADYVYNAEIGFADNSGSLLDLEEKGWADKEMLARATRWSLVPKDEAPKTLNGSAWPVVVVSIPDGAKPVFKSRVFGRFNVGGNSASSSNTLFRCYAIGWKKGKEERLIWVLPTGDIEFGEDPTMADLILERM